MTPTTKSTSAVQRARTVQVRPRERPSLLRGRCGGVGGTRAAWPRRACGAVDRSWTSGVEGLGGPGEGRRVRPSVCRPGLGKPQRRGPATVRAGPDGPAPGPDRPSRDPSRRSLGPVSRRCIAPIYLCYGRANKGVSLSHRPEPTVRPPSRGAAVVSRRAHLLRVRRLGLLHEGPDARLRTAAPAQQRPRPLRALSYGTLYPALTGCASAGSSPRPPTRCAPASGRASSTS